MNESIRSLFPVTQRFIYMNHAAVSPLSKPVRDAMVGITDDVMLNGTGNYDDWYRTYELARSAAARLVNAQAHEIAFMPNTSAGISAIATGLDFKTGDNIVSCEVEFPANVYPWMRLRQQLGITLKLAPERHGRIDPDELISLIDDRTRVVTLSWVQFASGFRSDLARIGRECRERGVFFMVDAIQGLGALKLDVERDFIDAFAADGHKYLLGTEGAGVLFVSDRVIEQVKPTVLGWTSVKKYDQFSHSALDYKLDYREGALRFEYGSLNTVGVYGLRAALDLFLEIGPEKIEEYILSLSDYLADRLKDKGYNVVSPRRTGESAALVCCTHA